jgi:hypothetical protein
MKKLVMVMFVVLLISGVSAISTDMKESYERGESMIIEVKGNILGNLNNKNVDFLRGHVSAPFEFDMIKLGGRYFLWAVMPETENNYTLVITDIETIVDRKNTKIDFIQDFKVEGDLIDYSVKPGAILTNEDFTINVKLNGDDNLDISVDFPSEKNVELRPGKNNIDFSVRKVEESGLKMISVGKYIVPVYIVVEDEKVEPRVKKIEFRVFPDLIESTKLVSDEIYYPFQIINIGEVLAEEIILDYNRERFFVTGVENITVQAGGFVELNVSFIGQIDQKTKEEGVSDIIVIKIGESEIELPIVIKFTEDVNQTGTPYIKNIENLKYCSAELRGEICDAEEICKGVSEVSFEGTCCLGKCELEEKTDNGYAWVGWLIGAVVLIVIIWVFVRYRKSKKPVGGFEKELENVEGKLGNVEENLGMKPRFSQNNKLNKV